MNFDLKPFANLGSANLRGADLRGANFLCADLRGVNLWGANLGSANLQDVKGLPPIVCPEKGSFIGFKKCENDRIVELEILQDAKCSSATTRKCRCSKAKVLSISNLDESKKNYKVAYSKYNKSFKYELGKIIEVKDFDENRWNECSTGIYFFITRQEAVDY